MINISQITQFHFLYTQLYKKTNANQLCTKKNIYIIYAIIYLYDHQNM